MVKKSRNKVEEYDLNQAILHKVTPLAAEAQDAMQSGELMAKGFKNLACEILAVYEAAGMKSKLSKREALYMVPQDLVVWTIGVAFAAGALAQQEAEKNAIAS